MHAAPPEIRVLEVFVGLVTEPMSDVLANESRREISCRPIAVNHGGRAPEQTGKTSKCFGSLLFPDPSRPDVAPRPRDLPPVSVCGDHQAVLLRHPSKRVIFSATTE